MPHADGQHGDSRSDDRGKESPSERFLRVARARLRAKRKKWRCPSCRRRYRIPVDHDPAMCPECSEHGPPSPATVEKSKILIEPPDPLVELLSRLTGRRFSDDSLVAAALAVVAIIALSVIPIVVNQPISAVERQGLAVAERRPRDVFDLLKTPAAKIPATKPRRDVVVSKAPTPDGLARGGPQSAPASAPPAAAVRPDSPKEHGERSPEDGDLSAVRAWLKQTLDDSNWEEVKWWPSKPVDDDLITIAGLLKADRVARLKYRVADEHGTQVLRDEVFVFRDNKVRAVPGGDNWWWDVWGGWTGLIIQGSRRLLPDANEQTARIGGAMKLPANTASGKTANARSKPAGLSPRQGERVGKTGPTPRARQASAKRTKGRKPAEPWWAKFADEADVDLVRTWLKDNVPDSEEIRWWKPRDFIEYHWSTNPRRSSIALVDPASNPFRFAGGGGMRADRVTRERVCRIKIRVKQSSKSPKVEDRLFRVDQGKVEEILDPDHKRHEWKYFPDSLGAKPKSAG
jgi:hypothetical protein